jgi:hypothetical protein
MGKWHLCLQFHSMKRKLSGPIKSRTASYVDMRGITITPRLRQKCLLNLTSMIDSLNPQNVYTGLYEAMTANACYRAV